MKKSKKGNMSKQSMRSRATKILQCREEVSIDLLYKVVEVVRRSDPKA